jgi:hypothetical protein
MQTVGEDGDVPSHERELGLLICTESGQNAGKSPRQSLTLDHA